MKDTNTAADTATNKQGEPSNVLVETIGKRIKIRTAIVSGRPNFGITQSEAQALVSAGKAKIVGTI